METMNIRLQCIRDFNQGGVTAKAGDVGEFAPPVASWILDSWPGSWQIAEVVAVDRLIEMADDLVNNAAIDAPPVDKMIHAPHKAKGKRK